MRPLLRPVGPLPARVYWARRSVLIVPVVLVVWLVSWLLVGDPSGNAAERDRHAAGSSDGLTPDTSASPRSPATTPASGSANKTPSASQPAAPGSKGAGAPSNAPSGAAEPPAAAKPPVAAQPTACTPERLEVGVAAAPDGPVPAGTEVPVAVVVGNEGSTACVLEVDARSFQVLVTSGDDRIWDTAHCPALVPARSVILPPNESSSLAVVWPGIRSREGCRPGQPRALPGYYAVEASVAGVVSARDRFQLT